jgi:hypothetical protein
MANCGFGHLADLRGNSLCIRGKVIIDDNRNIYGNTVVSQSNCIKTLLSNKVTEKVANNGVILDKSIPKNRPGVGKIILSNTNSSMNGDLYKLSAGQSIVFNQPNDWDLDFETTGFGPEYLLQLNTETSNVNAFTVPNTTDYSNECLTNFSYAYVECNVNFQGLNAVIVGADDIAKVRIQLLKNNTISSQATTQYKVLDADDVRYEFNLHIHDIVRCSPGDILNIKFINDSSNQEMGLSLTSDDTGTTSLSYATFKILSFEDATT